MAVATAIRPAGFAQALHGVLLTCAFPLFLGGFIADLAYARTYEIQWLNFAAWLVAGAMVFTGLAAALSLFETVRSRFRRPALIGFLLLAAIFILGLLNSFMHARDAWDAMPAGLLFSAIVTALAAGAVWFCVLAPRTGGAA